MRAAAVPFLKSLKTCGIKILQPPTGSPTWFSSVHPKIVLDTQVALEGQYWIDNMNGTIWFSQALEQAWQNLGPFDTDCH